MSPGLDRTIFYVDKPGHARDALVHELVMNGAVVVTGDDALDALARLSETDADVVIVGPDPGPPGALTLCRMARSRLRDAAVLALFEGPPRDVPVDPGFCDGTLFREMGAEAVAAALMLAQRREFDVPASSRRAPILADPTDRRGGVEHGYIDLAGEIAASIATNPPPQPPAPPVSDLPPSSRVPASRRSPPSVPPPSSARGASTGPLSMRDRSLESDPHSRPPSSHVAPVSRPSFAHPAAGVADAMPSGPPSSRTDQARLDAVAPFVDAGDWVRVCSTLAPHGSADSLPAALQLLYAVARKEAPDVPGSSDVDAIAIRAVSTLVGVAPTSPVALVLAKRMLRRNPVGLQREASTPFGLLIILLVAVLIGFFGWWGYLRNLMHG